MLGRQKGSSSRRGGKHERELGREAERERTRRCDERTHGVWGNKRGLTLWALSFAVGSPSSRPPEWIREFEQ